MNRPLIPLLAAVSIAVAAFSTTVAAQSTFPSKPITIFTSVPPGGILDWMGRAMGAELQKRWGQPVVVESRPGAGGWIAIQQVMKAPADGHTLFSNTQIVVHLPLFVKEAAVAFPRDIQPVAPVLYAPYVIFTNTQVPVKNMSEFAAHAKANPGKLNFALVPGSGQQLDTLWFIKRAGFDMVPIPYQGGAPALRAVLANEAQAYFGAAFGLDAQIKAGKITPLSVTSAQRFPQLPDVPTVKETLGFDMDSSVQYGFHTNGGTPKAIVERINREMAEISMKSDMTAQIRKQGYEPMTMTPDQWLTVMQAEARRGVETAQAAGIKPQ